MNKLVIALVVASMVIFPLGLLTANGPISVIGAVLLGSGAFIGVLLDMRIKGIN